MGESMLMLASSRDTLGFDPATGRLLSYRSSLAPEQEFVLGAERDPLCVIQYLDADRRFRQICSASAEQTRVRSHPGEIEIRLERLAGMALAVTMTIRASQDEPWSRWTLELENQAGLAITDVQYPFLVFPYSLGGRPGSESILWPYGAGVLYTAPRPQDLRPDHPHAWQFCPENGDCFHYPGYTVAQLLAYYNDRAGILAFCDDGEGRVKLIQPVHHEPGVRLGFSHVGDWPEKGSRTLEYAVRLQSFRGDWRDGAEIYRTWSLGQSWAREPLSRRKDVPAWLLDSPPHIIVRLQGILDAGPALPVPEFLPYEKCIPLLQGVADKVGSPVVPVIMSWEKPGPWIYPECFPPVGGEESLRSMCGQARKRGWHIGSFCNGTRWVTEHFWTPYDGWPHFRERGAERGVCRTAAGAMWQEAWDASWRPSYACCLGTELTNQVAEQFVSTLVGYGLDWVQFFDQNVGCSTFPCYATDHGHPAMPGSWMTDRMRRLLAAFHRIRAQSGREIVLSVEGPINEVFLQELQICDIRVVPPGHGHGSPGFGAGFVPLYHYLYHELVLIQGGFGSAPEPYHLPIRNAYNLVVGEIPGAVLQGDGVLLNKDTMNWAPWEPVVGKDADSVAMLRSATALRRGPGRDFLVLGRMQKPCHVTGVKTRRWREGGRYHQIPAVFHEAWQAPDGRTGVVLANWTDEEQQVTVSDPRLGLKGRLHRSGKSLTAKPVAAVKKVVVKVPPLGCALVEGSQA